MRCRILRLREVLHSETLTIWDTDTLRHSETTKIIEEKKIFPGSWKKNRLMSTWGMTSLMSLLMDNPFCFLSLFFSVGFFAVMNIYNAHIWDEFFPQSLLFEHCLRRGTHLSWPLKRELLPKLMFKHPHLHLKNSHREFMESRIRRYTVGYTQLLLLFS